MNDAYLLDTQIASIAWDGGNPQHVSIREKLARIEEDSISICVITMAEILYGLLTTPYADPARHYAVRQALTKYYTRNIDHHTVEVYAEIRAKLFELYAPKNRRGRFTKKHPEDLLDKTTAKELGIQENDLWIVSVAVQYDLRFITADKKMKRIIDIAKDTLAYDRAEFWDMDAYNSKP